MILRALLKWSGPQLALVVAGAFAAERPLILHPKCEQLPTALLGPFVQLRDGGVLAVDTSEVHVSHDAGRTWKARPLFTDAGKFSTRPERTVLRARSGVVVIAFANACT